MSIRSYDTFENEAELHSIIKRNKSKIINYISQPDLWNTPIKKTNVKNLKTNN